MYLFSKQATLLLLSFSISIAIKSQSIYTGERWPNLHFKEVWNYQKPDLELADFNGRPIILDFWTHSCKPCIEAFSHLDSLQMQFKDRIQFILINPESKDSTIRFFKRMKKLYVPKNIPMVTGEKGLCNEMMQLGYLWLDSSLVFKYAGGPRTVTTDNIRKFIAQTPLTFKQNRLVADLNIDVPLIAEGQGRWLDSVNFYSYLFHHEFNMPTLREFIPGKNSPLNRLCLPNRLVIQLFQAAFNRGSRDASTALPMEVRVKDSSLFFAPAGIKADENWDIRHRYTYDVKVPLSRANSIFTIMQRDLEMHFGVKAEVQLLEKECWVLESLDDRLFISTQGPAFSNTGRPVTDSINRYKHWPADRLIKSFQAHFLNFSTLPLISQLSYSGPMNFEIHRGVFSSGNMNLLKEAMNKNGLNIRRTKAKIPVLVITDQ